MRKQIFSLSLGFLFIVANVYMAVGAAQDEGIPITTYYDSPDLVAKNLESKTMTVDSVFTIKSGGYLEVNEDIDEDPLNPAKSIIRIDDIGLTFSRDAYVRNTLVYNCDGGSCTGAGPTPAYLNSFRNYTLADSVAYDSIELRGIALNSMPVLRSGVGGPGLSNTLANCDASFNNYENEQDSCFIDNAGNEAAIEGCIDGLRSVVRSCFMDITEDCSGKRCSKKKAMQTLSKTGEAVFGIGAGVSVGDPFGVGGVIAFGFGSGLSSDYSTFEYDTDF